MIRDIILFCMLLAMLDIASTLDRAYDSQRDAIRFAEVVW